MAKKKPAKINNDCQIFYGDCRKVLPLRVVPGSVALVCADPPYNLGQDYDAYDDKKTREEYMRFTVQWLAAAKEALHKHGALWLAIGTHFVSEVDVLAKSMGFHKRAQVVWYYTFGQNSSGNFTRSHTYWLYYTKSKSKYTFNVDDPAVRVPSARQLIYNDKRANPKGRLPDDTWILRPQDAPDAFQPAHDVWTFSRICGTFKAKLKVSPNQMPVAMIDRIVRLCSNERDLVVDPFSGTGTTAEACARINRRFVGCDVSEACVKVGNERLAATYADMERKKRLDGEQGKLFK
jgi:DNA modification methylase